MMKILRWLGAVVLLAAMAAAVVNWRQVQQLRSENERLRAQWQEFKAQSELGAEAQAKRHDEELQRLRTQAQEVFKLRSEVTQLRSAAHEAETLRGENRQLRSQNQQLQSGAVSGAPAPVATAVAPGAQTGGDQFPRETWTFAGYSTPEAALVSAVWAMKEGKPQMYLDSLSPEEQARMAKAWENKPESEVAAKHQQDVSKITGVRILDRQQVSPEEIRMNVFIDGPGRTETVSMKRVGGDWKFGGFIRSQTK